MKKIFLNCILLGLIACTGCSPISKEYVGEYEVVSVEFGIPQTAPINIKDVQWETKKDEKIKLDLAKDGIPDFISSKIMIAKDGTCRVVNTVKKGLYIRIDCFDRFINQRTGKIDLVKKFVTETTYVPIETRSEVAVQIDDGIYQVVNVLPDIDIHYCEEKNGGLLFYQSTKMKEYGAEYAEYDKFKHTIKYVRGKNQNVYLLKKVK